ncbi:MAG: leucine-rich repeat protein [Clostridia bacterium]|nr:leucine-rich repeat protein [Clostridia bacterium]
MKKIALIILSVSLILLCILSLASCSEPFTAPKGLAIDGDTYTLSWKRVPEAKKYVIQVEGEEREKSTSATSVSLEYLDPGTYEIKVRALSIDPEAEPSEWVSITFERPEESGLRFKLINNKTEYQVTGGGDAAGDVVMESIYRGKPVTSIADGAFKNNRKITSLTLSENVTTIGKNAFLKAYELQSVTIPDSVKTIGPYAFQSCKKLTSITLPASLTEVPAYMFSWCAALEEVKIGDSVVSISESAFSNCEALTTVDIPASVKYIGEYAFSGCDALASVTGAEGLTEIANYGFSKCAALTSPAFGDGLEIIGDFAFEECEKLAEFNAPVSLITIGESAFQKCTALTTVNLGEKVERVGLNAFFGTKLFEDAENEIYIDSWFIGAKKRDFEEFTLKEGTYGLADGAFAMCAKLEKVNFPGVKHIGELAFYGCSSLWEATFDNALLSIGNSAFSYCSVLTDVTLGNSLTTIGDYAFFEALMLEDTIDLPDTVTKVGQHIMYNTRAYKDAESVVYLDDWAVELKPNLYTDIIIDDKKNVRGIADYAFYKAVVFYSIYIPDTVEYIGASALSGCDSAKLISLPKSLKVISDYAFYGCNNALFIANDAKTLDGITRIPVGTEYVGRSSFYECSMMVGLDIPGTVKEIGPYAFFKCVNLGKSQVYFEDNPDEFLYGEVTLGEGIEKIGDKVFYACSALDKIALPDSLVSLGGRVFYKCEQLEEVKLGAGVTYIPDYTFYDCIAIKSIEFSDEIETIGNYAFRGCSALEELNIGKGIKKIGDFAFYACTSLRKVIIPDGVEVIGNYTFRGEASVTTVIIPESVTTIGKHAFYGMKKATIYCESELIPAYWDERWNTSFRPVVWGVTLSEDGSYIVSVALKDGSVENTDIADVTFAPARAGYTCIGWSTSPEATEAEYTPETFTKVTAGTTLYAVYTEGEPVEEPEAPAPETPAPETNNSENTNNNNASDGNTPSDGATIG